jgi:hypothetical protein
VTLLVGLCSRYRNGAPRKSTAEAEKRQADAFIRRLQAENSRLVQENQRLRDCIAETIINFGLVESDASRLVERAKAHLQEATSGAE